MLQFYCWTNRPPICDPINERQVIDAIFENNPEKGILMITHRLVGMEEMDEILVLESGDCHRAGHSPGAAGIGRDVSKDVAAWSGLHHRIKEQPGRIDAQSR